MSKILILADDCNPEWPSLPVVAYKQLRALSNLTDLVVATHIRNKPNIDKVGMGRAKVHYIDNEYLARPFYQLGSFLRGGDQVGMTTNVAMYYLPYLSFEWEVWKAFEGQLKLGEFDLVHRLSPMSPTLPSPMAKWSPAPFMIGPLNGGLKWPKEFEEERRREKEWLSKLRHFHTILPYYKATYSYAAKILAAFDHTKWDLPPSCRDRIVSFPEVGIDPDLFRTTDRRPSKKKTLLYAGRLVPYKCPDVVIHAIGRSASLQQHHLKVVGAGPEEGRLQELVSHYHIEECVEFCGQKTQKELGQIMREAHILTFPSVRELGAGILVEAMASGLACVVVDYGAPGSLIYSSDVGVKVPLKGKEELISDYQQALEALVNEDDRLLSISSAASTYALEHFSWDRKAVQLNEIYENTLKN